MSVDLSKIRAGDELTIRCRAHQQLTGGWAVRALHDEKCSVVLSEHIIGHTPQPINIGAHVRVRGESGYIVHGQRGDVYWCIREDPLRFESAHISVVERDDA